MNTSISSLTLQQRQKGIKDKKFKLSFIVPVYNEGDAIVEFVAALSKFAANITNNFEIICINDGSIDDSYGTLLSIKDSYPLKIISLSRNFGKEIAMTAGLEHCKSSDAAIIIDADFQHPFETMIEFVSLWGEGYDMVYGVRQNRQLKSKFRASLTNVFYMIMKSISKINIVPDATDFRILDRKVINALTACTEKNKLMKGLYAWVGFKNKAIPYQEQERKEGDSSFNFLSLLELSITGITAFSNIPLRIWALTGIFISLISLGYALFTVIKTLMFGVDVPGYASLIVSISFFGGLQLMSIGFLGEYISRIFNEVKGRPQYLIAEKIGFEE